MTPAPIFLMSAPFSGACVAAAMLGRHPQLYALPPLNLFMAREVDELLEIFRLSQGPAADGLLRAVAELVFEQQSDAGIAAAREWLEQRRGEPVGAILSALARKAAPRRLVIPDSETPMRPADIDRLLAQVPDARFVHLLRHPWSQGVVLHALNRERLFAPVDYKDFSHTPPPLDPQIPWLRANRNVLEWIVAARPAHCHRLLWEPLIAAPHDTLAALCASLELDHAPAALAQVAEYDDWIFWGHGPAAAPYGLDAEVLEDLSDEVLDAAFIDPRLDQPLPWRADGAPFAPAVAALARSFGYS